MTENRMQRLRTVLEGPLVLWLILLSAVALIWPHLNPFFTSIDPFTVSRPILPYLIAVTMMAIGSLLPHDEIRQVIQRWPTVLGGTAVQYITMPVLAYGMGRLFGLSDAWLIGIVMVGCVPGAMASNVLTLIARGNASYSVSLTTSATLLSPLIVPWVLYLLLGQTVDNFPTGKVCIDLLWMVVVPVVSGHLLSRAWPRYKMVAETLGPIIANLTILWIIAVVVALNRSQFSDLQWQLLLALLAVNIGGYTCGAAGSWLLRIPASMRRALTLEVGMQNAGLGTTLALGLFPDLPAAALPAALYTFGCMLTGTLLARYWARKSINDAPQSAEAAVGVSGSAVPPP
jgi:BASS family bile acid:Na+ symporter